MTIIELEKKLKEANIEVSDFKMYTSFAIKLKNNKITLNLTHSGKLLIDGGNIDKILELKQILGVE